MRFAYDTRFEPAAPALPVLLSSTRETPSSIEQLALIDTGSDITCVPVSLLVTIGAIRTRRVVARDFASRAQRGFLYRVALAVAGETFDRWRVLGTQGDELLIGRDILNQLAMDLNGPARLMTIY